MRRSLALGLVMVFAVAGCRGDGNKGGGDGGLPDGGGGKVSIYDIQMGNVPEGTGVVLEDVVVVAIDKYGSGSTTGSIHVMEPAGGEYSGIFVFRPQIMGGTIDDVNPGDLVKVSGGVVTEFAQMGDDSGRTLTQIAAAQGGTVIVEVTGTGQIPAPAVVDPVALAADDNESEKWEGVLVTFENVAVTSGPRSVSMSDPTLTEMRVTGPYRVSAQLAPLEVGGNAIQRDDCFTSITGIMDYVFDYKILPRAESDLVAAADMTSCLYEDTAELCMNGMDDDHDGFPDCMDFSCQQNVPACAQDASITDIQDGTIPVGSRVQVSGVVTAVALDVGTNMFDYVWIQEPAGGPYSGVVVFNPMASGGTVADLAIGDVVDVNAEVDEFNGVTELVNGTITETGTQTPLAPLTVTVAELADPAMAEPYEGVLIQVENVRVQSTNPDAPMNFGEWTVGDATNQIRVDDMMYRPAVVMMGACYATVAGPLHYSFGNFKIEPRAATDAIPGAGCP